MACAVRHDRRSRPARTRRPREPRAERSTSPLDGDRASIGERVDAACPKRVKRNRATREKKGVPLRRIAPLCIVAWSERVPSRRVGPSGSLAARRRRSRLIEAQPPAATAPGADERCDEAETRAPSALVGSARSHEPSGPRTLGVVEDSERPTRLDLGPRRGRKRRRLALAPPAAASGLIREALRRCSGSRPRHTSRQRPAPWPRAAAPPSARAARALRHGAGARPRSPPSPRETRRTDRSFEDLALGLVESRTAPACGQAIRTVRRVPTALAFDHASHARNRRGLRTSDESAPTWAPRSRSNACIREALRRCSGLRPRHTSRQRPAPWPRAAAPPSARAARALRHGAGARPRSPPSPRETRRTDRSFEDLALGRTVPILAARRVETRRVPTALAFDHASHPRNRRGLRTSDESAPTWAPRSRSNA